MGKYKTPKAWGEIRNNLAGSIQIHAASRSNPASLALIPLVSSTSVPSDRHILFLPEEFSRHFHCIRHGSEQSSPRVRSEGPPGHQGEQPEQQSQGAQRERERERRRLGCDLAGFKFVVRCCYHYTHSVVSLPHPPRHLPPPSTLPSHSPPSESLQPIQRTLNQGRSGHPAQLPSWLPMPRGMH